MTLTRAFIMRRTEVEYEEFERVVGSNFPADELFPLKCPRCAIFQFGAKAIVAYLRGLNKLEDLPDCLGSDGLLLSKYKTPYECTGYRLPTDAEWEYAARAGTTTDTYVGDLGKYNPNKPCEQSAALLDQIAWYACNSGDNGKVKPTGQKAPNPWGLHDMLGNFYEITLDAFPPFSKTVTAPPVDPWVAPAFGYEYMWLISRGGCYHTHPCTMYIGRARYPFYLAHGNDDMTIRPVRTLP